MLIKNQILSNDDDEVLLALIGLKPNDLILFSRDGLFDVKMNGIPLNEGNRVINHKFINFSHHERFLPPKLYA